MTAIRFEGQTALVTGAGAGLGRAYALELARRGANLVINDLGAGLDGAGAAGGAAEAVAAEIRALGGRAIADGASVTDDAAMATLVDRARGEFGRIDILIANAGALRDRTFGRMSTEDFAFVLDVHVMGAVKPIKAVWEAFRAQNYGRILLTTSASGLYGNFGQTNYAAAKMALVGLMNALALEGAKHDVRVNAIAPIAATRMTDGLFPPQLAERLTPEAVVPGVMYLCSREAPTGAVLVAGGGVFARARVVETAGVALGPHAAAEDVAAAWARIEDPTGQSGLAQAAAQLPKLLEALGGPIDP